MQNAINTNEGELNTNMQRLNAFSLAQKLQRTRMVVAAEISNDLSERYGI
jgi:hypothetical protein